MFLRSTYVGYMLRMYYDMLFSLHMCVEEPDWFISFEIGFPTFGLV